MHQRAITATKPKQRVWGKLIVKIGTQILKDLGKIKKFFGVQLAAVYYTVNCRCCLFACFFHSNYNYSASSSIKVVFIFFLPNKIL